MCRCDIRPVPVLAPVPLDPGRGGLQTAGLDIRNVSKIYLDYQEKYLKYSTVFQDLLQFGADHILLLLGEISSDLSSYLSVHHGGHCSDHQVRSRYNLQCRWCICFGYWRGLKRFCIRSLNELKLQIVYSSRSRETNSEFVHSGKQ